MLSKILKLSAPTIAVHLTKLLELCNSTSTWPAEWKLSHVTTVFKKDNATSVSNYRPTSVLSVIPKILEKVMFDQLYDAFQPLFSSYISGSLRWHSCCTALAKMVDDWRLALDSKKVTASIAVDLSKALDSICHNLLLAKLRAYGVGEEAIDFLHSYLSGRKQRAKVNGVVSDWLLVYCGVSQGILLGPLLFNVFINDLNFSVQLSSLRLYVDDTTACASNTTFQLWNCLLTKILRISHPSLPQIICPSMARKPKRWSWVSTLMNLLFILVTLFSTYGFLDILGVSIRCPLKTIYHLFFEGLCQGWSSETTLKAGVCWHLTYIHPHLECCSPLLLRINKTLNKKLESANYYALKALLNFRNSLDYDSILSAVNMQ